MSKQEVKLTTALAPVPIVMVTSGDMEQSNVATFAWTGTVNSEPPYVYVSIRKSRYTHELIKKNKEFVLNIPNDKLVVEADYCGTKSGKFFDKFKDMKLKKILAKEVKAPLIEECPINIECKLVDINSYGTHDMFIGEIVCVHADEEYVDRNKEIDYRNTNLLTYAGQQYFSANNFIAKRGVSLSRN